MPTGIELVARMRVIVQDESWRTSDLLGYLNEAAQAVAGGIELPDGTQSLPLPDLAISTDVDTDINEVYIALPTGAGEAYQRNLFFVTSALQERRIMVHNSHVMFLKQYPVLDVVGDVTDVSVHGQRLYYQGKPASAETLTLHYHRKPSAIASDSTVPVGVPEHLQYQVLCNYAAMLIFKRIEDGQDDGSPNTVRVKGAFYEGMMSLQRICHNHIDAEPHTVPDHSASVDGDGW